MRNNIKLFSIGAAIVLLLISAHAAVAKEVPPELERQLQDYFRNYESERTTVQTYLDSLDGSVPPANLPIQIQLAMSTLVQGMTPIVQQCTQGAVTPGVNGYWLTSPAPPTYTGYCISLTKGVTNFFSIMITIGGEDIDPVDILVVIEVVLLLSFIIIPLNVLFSFGVLLGLNWNWDTFIDWMLIAGSWNNYGLVWYFFKTPRIPFGYEQWAQPQNFTPSWKHPEYFWVSG